MICHKHKCIFIHLQCTGGTYIEDQIVGKDWYHIDAKTKHLSALQAKETYKEYWEDYFKFSFVRNPWARMVGMAKFMSPTFLGDYFVFGAGNDPFTGHDSQLHREIYADHSEFSRIADDFGIPCDLRDISLFRGLKIPVAKYILGRSLEMYKTKFSYPLTREYEYRFYDDPEKICPHPAKQTIYGNLLNADLDFIGTYENFVEDLLRVYERIKCVSQPKFKNHYARDYLSYYTPVTREVVNDLYKKDIKTYKWSFQNEY